MSEHYFSPRPGRASRPRIVAFAVAGHDYELATDTGVFSGSRLDPGTGVLLREALVPRNGGTLLDLGCGYGPIACVLAVRAPAATVWAVDVNERALELTRANVDAIGVGSRVHVARPDDVPDDVTYDEIWSNPPVRVGKAALHELLQRWLPRLAPDGTAWLVAGKNLGGDSLQRWLGEGGWDCRRHASSRGFRVLRATRG